MMAVACWGSGPSTQGSDSPQTSQSCAAQCRPLTVHPLSHPPRASQNVLSFNPQEQQEGTATVLTEPVTAGQGQARSLVNRRTASHQTTLLLGADPVPTRRPPRPRRSAYGDQKHATPGEALSAAHACPSVALTLMASLRTHTDDVDSL